MMLAKLIYQLYFNRTYFYGLIGLDFLFIFAFGIIYSSLLPRLQGSPALRFNTIRDGQVFEGPVTDYLNCFYFSVITQMTVGFGDIIPATNLAKVVVSFQAAFGYFYLAVLISVLVGRVFLNKNVQSILNFPHYN